MKRGRVCMLTTEHSALDVRIFYRESMILNRGGYEVINLVPLRDGFLVDMGGKRINGTQIYFEGIKTEGFSLKTSPFSPKVRNVIRWIKLWSAGKIDPFPKYEELVSKAIEIEADVYHSHEIDSLCAAFHIQKALEKRGKRPKIVYDLHEFTPSGSESVRRRLWRRIFRSLIIHFEKGTLHRVDYAIVTNQIQAGYLLSLNPFANVEVIHNISNHSLIPQPPSATPKPDEITLCYLGYLRFYRGLEAMIEVMRCLHKRYGNRIKLLIIGNLDGAEKEYTDRKMAEYSLGNTISCTGWLPHDEIGKALCRADIGLMFLQRTENNMMITPTKLFDYMTFGVPVVTTDLPGTSHIVLETKCGIVAPDSVERLAAAVSELIENEPKRIAMGTRGKRAVEEKYGWAIIESRLLQMYNRLLSS